MSLRLYPFRQYSEYDVVNLFASDTVDTLPSTNGNGSAGVFVKVSAGNLDLDPITYATNDTVLGKTDYPFLGAAQYPSVPLLFLVLRLTKLYSLMKMVRSFSITQSREPNYKPFFLDKLYL
jgi:hypothetical protein